MDTKTVYYYDDAGYYAQDVILDNTDKSPSNTWNIPANCSEIKPEIKEGYKYKWDGTKWIEKIIPYDVFCYYNDGLEFKSVKSDYSVQTGEVIFEKTPTTEELQKAFTNYDVAYLKALKESKYSELRDCLSKTDYKQNEFLDGRCTEAEYTPVKTKRITWTNAYHSIENAKTIDEVNAVTYDKE